MENLSPNVQFSTHVIQRERIMSSDEQMKDFSRTAFALLDTDGDGLIGEADLIKLCTLLNQTEGSPTGQQHYDLDLLKRVLLKGNPSNRIDLQAFYHWNMKTMSGFVGLLGHDFGTDRQPRSSQAHSQSSSQSSQIRVLSER